MLPRFRGGKKVPPQLARMDAEDLVAAIFPDQLACAENVPGEREIPDHPLVRQAIHDCLNEGMDIVGLERLLARIEAGKVRVVARDLTEPSPLALEVLSARPYAYLDDAPLEERRTQAVMARRWLAPEDAADLGRLDPDAIARVRGEAGPRRSTPTKMHDALVWLGLLAAREVGNVLPAGPAGSASWPPAGVPRGCVAARRDMCGSPPSACRNSKRCGPRRRSTLLSPRRLSYAEGAHGPPTWRSSKSCAAGWRVSGR